MRVVKQLEIQIKSYDKKKNRPDIFPAAIYKSKLGTANIFMNGKIVIITTRKENVAPIVKNIEEIIAINKATIPL